MRRLGAARWVALALLGLAIAGGVALAASRLASQQIGIASESIKAGKALAPTGLVGKGGGEKAGQGRAPQREGGEEHTEPAPAPPSAPPSAGPGTTPSEPAHEDHRGGEGADD